MGTHPCQKCGACCSSYLVRFHWSETLPESHNVPSNLTVTVEDHLLAMNGTNQKRVRCVALEGRIGDEVRCSIYERRPSCCRQFRPSYENGERNNRCERARSSKGLEPLTPDDWIDLSTDLGLRES